MELFLLTVLVGLASFVAWTSWKAYRLLAVLEEDAHTE